MANIDRRPLADAPAADLIRQHADNRLGAVYSALYSFWSARHAAVTAGQQRAGAGQDAYSVVLFSGQATNVLANDFTSTSWVLCWPNGHHLARISQKLSERLVPS